MDEKVFKERLLMSLAVLAVAGAVIPIGLAACGQLPGPGGAPDRESIQQLASRICNAPPGIMQQVPADVRAAIATMCGKLASLPASPEI